MNISYIPLCSMLDKKLLLKEIFWKGSHKTQRKEEYCEIFETRSFGEERLKNFQKQGDYSHSWADRKKWTKMGGSPCWMERDGRSAEYFDAIVSASAKIYLLLSKKCVSFMWLDQFILAQPFLMGFQHPVIL